MPLSQYQHWTGDVGSAARPVNWDVVFQLTIPMCRRTCFVLAPWEAPLPLQRAWMLWEALITLASPSTHLAVVVPPAEMIGFLRALQDDDIDKIESTLTEVDSRKAVCYTPTD